MPTRHNVRKHINLLQTMCASHLFLYVYSSTDTLTELRQARLKKKKPKNLHFSMLQFLNARAHKLLSKSMSSSTKCLVVVYLVYYLFLCKQVTNELHLSFARIYSSGTLTETCTNSCFAPSSTVYAQVYFTYLQFFSLFFHLKPLYWTSVKKKNIKLFTDAIISMFGL